MADIFIPSVSSGGATDSNKQIERIMEVERIPLQRMEDDRTQLRTEQDTWSSVKRNLSSLLESSRSMYQFNNPFSARIIESSNERVVVGRSLNNSLLGTYEVTVEQKATADRFASDPIDSDYAVSSGNYGFSVGSADIEIAFDGGSLEELAQTITINGQGKLTASLIQVTDSQSVFLIASRETGKTNTLAFHGSTKKLATEIGILGAAQTEPLLFSESFVTAIDEPEFQLGPGEQASFFVKNNVHALHIKSDDALTATISGSQENSRTEQGSTIAIDRDAIDMSKVVIENTSDAPTTVQISAFSPSRPTPQNPITQAQNAIVTIEGITVERPTNDFDEILPGVSLEVRSPSDTPVELIVSPDIELAKQEVIRLVGNYNVTLQQVNILTRDDPTVVDDIAFATEEERNAALEELGTLRGDTLLTRLRSRLVSAVSNMIRVGGSVSFLSEIGISTNQHSVGTLNSTSLNGYLEINESSLDAALSNSFEHVSKLFGNDSDGNQIIDNGFAFSVSEAIEQYTQSGGIIDVRTQRISNQIREADTQIERYSDKLEDKEAELRRQFAVMEQQVQSLQDNTRALDGFLRRE